MVAYKKADGDIIKSKASAKKSIYFVAVPSGVGVKGGTESLKVSWKKVSGVTSYTVEYATDSKFATKETVSVKDAKTVSKVIKNLSAKKKYYVRVCAKKTIDGKTYRSAWSSPKKGTTK